MASFEVALAGDEGLVQILKDLFVREAFQGRLHGPDGRFELAVLQPSRHVGAGVADKRLPGELRLSLQRALVIFKERLLLRIDAHGLFQCLEGLVVVFGLQKHFGL